ncbi:MAG: hypothetical protein QNL36_11830 [Crocinitomicaceae bacterium]|jgi:hypothetical protein|nr:hypothetical protein [Crocinitomicaceae bacterium]|tara:strand:- start:474 stop:1148 length:675 start_codon:yes stop_codon:yes gene_type:complete
MKSRLVLFNLLLLLSSCGVRYSAITFCKVDCKASAHHNIISDDNKTDIPINEMSYKIANNSLSQDSFMKGDYPDSKINSEDIASKNEVMPLIIVNPSIDKNKKHSTFNRAVSLHKSMSSSQSKSNDPYVKSEAARTGGTIGMIAILIAAILGLFILIFLGESWQLILAIIGMAAIVSSIIYFMQRLFRRESSQVTNKKRWIIALSIAFGSMAVLVAVLFGLSWF